MSRVSRPLRDRSHSVAKTTEIRRIQHSEFVTLTVIIAAATELLKFADNGVNKLCAPRLPRRRSSARRIDCVYFSTGDEIATGAPRGRALLYCSVAVCRLGAWSKVAVLSWNGRVGSTNARSTWFIAKPRGPSHPCIAAEF